MRPSTSPAYSALWKRDIGSPLESAIFCIFDSLSVLPVARYRNDSRSKFFVCWYAFSTIYMRSYVSLHDRAAPALQTLWLPCFSAC